MNKVPAMLASEAFLLLALLGLGGMLINGFSDLLRARRFGAIRNGLVVGRMIYRSADAKAFDAVRRRRTVELTLLALPVGLLACLAVGLRIGDYAAEP